MPSWRPETPEQKQVEEFLTGMMNLAMMGLANLVSSAATEKDLNGEQLHVDEAYEQSLET